MDSNCHILCWDEENLDASSSSKDNYERRYPEPHIHTLTFEHVLNTVRIPESSKSRLQTPVRLPRRHAQYAYAHVQISQDDCTRALAFIPVHEL